MKKTAVGLWILAMVALSVFLPSYTTIEELKERNARYQREIERLTREQANLKQEKRLLRDDPEYLEKVAREKMGLIKEGEVIYRIKPMLNKEVAPKKNFRP